MSRRVSADDWSAAGLALLRDEGLEALTVDRLCAALHRTKGSFYHHFRDLDAYLAALLQRWEAELTEAPIRAAAREPDPARRGAKLDAVVRGLDHRLDCAVRDWSRRDPRARAAMERIDRRRIDAIAAIHRAAGRRDARLLASLEYVAFVGAQQLGLFSAPARAARLSRAMQRALQRMSGGR